MVSRSSRRRLERISAIGLRRPSAHLSVEFSVSFERAARGPKTPLARVRIAPWGRRKRLEVGHPGHGRVETAWPKRLVGLAGDDGDRFWNILFRKEPSAREL